MVPEFYSIAQVADILSLSKETLRRWDDNGSLVPERNPENNYRVYHRSQLEKFEQARLLFNSEWDKEKSIKPNRPYKLIELFAGAGGLAIGMEKAGFESIMLNEIDKYACDTLRKNRPNWNVIEGSIANVDFKPYKGDVDILSGGFPCQAFSYAGKKLGFEDTRGTLFYEFGRALKECSPKVFIAENVRGLVSHDEGRTLETIMSVLRDLGYTVLEPRILKA
ncbi:MAG: DNA (cytosine-5-)-methyltransferase, partial [Flavobacteriaceae bacterium]|nr:DNA (cytosine-5-)-methyltransferase [Flavobacteriaceae bacterium]